MGKHLLSGIKFDREDCAEQDVNLLEGSRNATLAFPSIVLQLTILNSFCAQLIFVLMSTNNIWYQAITQKRNGIKTLKVNFFQFLSILLKK